MKYNEMGKKMKFIKIEDRKKRNLLKVKMKLRKICPFTFCTNSYPIISIFILMARKK